MFFPSFSLPESPPRDLQISVLLQTMFCSCAIETTFWCENSRSLPQPVREWFDNFSWSKEQWSNDKTIIELAYRKTSWFACVSQMNYLPQPSPSANNWSARRWQITINVNLSLTDLHSIVLSPPLPTNPSPLKMQKKKEIQKSNKGLVQNFTFK